MNKLSKLRLQKITKKYGIRYTVGDSNPVQAWIFSGLLFHNCSSCVLNCDDQSYLHMFLLRSNTLSFLYSFTLFTFHGYITNSECDQPHSWLDSSVGRALHRYRKSYGFDSRSGPIFFSGFNFTIVVCIAAMINHIFMCLHSSKHYLSYISIAFTFYGYITNSECDQPLSWLDSLVGRALHRYRKSYGFDSRSGPIFFFRL